MKIWGFRLKARKSKTKAVSSFLGYAGDLQVIEPKMMLNLAMASETYASTSHCISLLRQNSEAWEQVHSAFDVSVESVRLVPSIY
jgi:hypothetical protein